MKYGAFENPEVILCRPDDPSLNVSLPDDQITIWQGCDSPTHVAIPADAPDDKLEWVADRLNGRVSMAELVTFRDQLQDKTAGQNL